jgi:hypothetical protein
MWDAVSAARALLSGRIAAPLGFTAGVFRFFSEPLNFHCELTIVARIGSLLDECATRAEAARCVQIWTFGSFPTLVRNECKGGDYPP